MACKLHQVYLVYAAGVMFFQTHDVKLLASFCPGQKMNVRQTFLSPLKPYIVNLYSRTRHSEPQTLNS